MTNIKDYPELVNPSDADWLLIQENASIPAYKKAQLINIRGSGSSNSINSTSWIYRDGSIDFNINLDNKIIVDTPRDVLITVENSLEGTEIQLKRIREDNSLSIAGISKVEGKSVDANSLIKINFEDTPTKLIYVNSIVGWIIFPKSSFTIFTSLSLPADGLIQLFNAGSITAQDGSKITQWDDDIGSRNALQSDESLQAEYRKSVFRGGEVGGVLFISPQEYEVDFSYLANEKYTIAIVEARTYNGQNYILGNSSNGLHVGYRIATQFTLGHYGNDLDASISPYNDSFFPTLWLVSNNSRGKEIYQNGSLIESNNNFDDLTEVDSGRIGSALGSRYDGYLGLIAVWTGDKTSNELDNINNAINSNFGIY